MSRSQEYHKITDALEEVNYEKVCRECKRLLPRSAFSKSSTCVDYHSNCCKCCTSRYHRKRTYGISDKTLDDMLSVEACQMPGCGEKLTNGQGTHFDHCHTSGKVREVLCQRCNTMLGHIEKNMHLVQHMVDYIARHREEHEPA